MKSIKIYCVKRNKFRKFVIPKFFYIFDETWVLFIIICQEKRQVKNID